MKKNIALILLVFAVSGCAFLRNIGLIEEKEYVAKVGREIITLDEFEKSFAKNNGGFTKAKERPLDERKNYLDLLVKYKLKVLDAKAQNLEKDPNIQKEIKDYYTTLALSYLTKKEVVEPGLKQFYERRKEEIRARHILIEIFYGDTLSAYNRAMSIIRELEANVPWDSLIGHSDDPTVIFNKGDLYYFTAGTMVPEFEDVCYSMKVGERTKTPVRTRFGYHVIEILDRKPRVEMVRLSHIGKKLERDAKPEDTLRIYNELKAILDSIRQGYDFNTLAERHSDDRFTKERRGDIGYYSRGQAYREIEDFAFNAKAGDVSDIIRTRWGYHIIKVTEVVPVKPFDEIVDELNRTYQSQRLEYDFKKYIEKLKKEYNFKLNQQTLEIFISKADTAKTASHFEWDTSYTKEDRAKILFEFADRKITLDSAIKIIKKSPEFTGRKLDRPGITAMVDRIIEMKLTEYRARNVEKIYPEFKDELREFVDGILLYHIEQKMVWDRVDLSEEKLKEFYNKHKENYRFPDRVRFSEIWVTSESLAKDIYSQLKNGVPFDSLVVKYTERAGMKEKKGDWGLVEASENELTWTAWNMKVNEISEPIKFQGGYSIIKVTGKEPSRVKTFEEAFGEVAGALQEQELKRLEKEWVENLKKKYKVVINEKALEKAFNR
ncbi:MAG: peptidylprolyl isomerase [Candidatus Kryptonium sp.]|nr:peptidylprolyl isomerase [Candidatus Kryptonium sp.]MCX7761519.1 peptidylprolyl isomerase [Candidatus Kryptonium sp.]